MHVFPINPEAPSVSEPAERPDLYGRGDAVLERVKVVSQKIQERVRQVFEDTLPVRPTQEDAASDCTTDS